MSNRSIFFLKSLKGVFIREVCSFDLHVQQDVEVLEILLEELTGSSIITSAAYNIKRLTNTIRHTYHQLNRTEDVLPILRLPVLKDSPTRLAKILETESLISSNAPSLSWFDWSLVISWVKYYVRSADIACWERPAYSRKVWNVLIFLFVCLFWFVFLFLFLFCFDFCFIFVQFFLFLFCFVVFYCWCCCCFFFVCFDPFLLLLFLCVFLFLFLIFWFDLLSLKTFSISLLFLSPYSSYQL